MRAARIILLLLALALPAPALAHAEFRGSTPPSEAELDAAPTEITLDFSEPVAPLVMRLVADGQAPVEIAAQSRNTRVVVPLPATLGKGTHLLSWRVVSADGHPIGGALVFAVGAPVMPHRMADGAGDAAELAALARFGLTLALVAGIGATVFIILVARDIRVAWPIRWIAALGSAAVLPMAAVAVAAQGLDMMGLPAGALASAAAWRAGTLSPTGLTALLAALAAVVALDALALRDPRERLPRGLAAWALAALSFAASGHATVADPRWLATPAVALHGLALIFWMGALGPLLILLHTEEDAAPPVRRFSALAAPLVAVLVVTGALLTVLQSGSLRALLSSGYGAVLMVKLAAVAALLALAARNRLKYTPGLETGSIGARWHMGRTIRHEILLGLMVLALASSFRLTPPPRSTAAAMPMLTQALHGRQAMGVLTLTPGHVGPNQVTLRLSDHTGASLKPLEVHLEFSQPSQDIQPIRLPATLAADGTWTAGPVTLPLAGDWQVDASVLITDFSEETLSHTLTLDAR